jgi:plastocyanin
MASAVRSFTSMSTSRLLLAISLFTAAALPARAAALDVQVSDEAGNPLIDAVVMLEPAAGKVAVKPMADVDVAQSKRAFQPRVTLISVGTRVNFPNFDTVRHHVYSFSAPKTFELKLYAGVPAAPLSFDKPGIVTLGCNIHDRMAAWIVVADTPFAARSGADGQAHVELPAGAYKLVVWHPGLAGAAPLAPQALTVGAADMKHAVRLAVKAEP